MNNDSDCYPICGHGLVLNDNIYSNYDYIIVFEKIHGLDKNAINGIFYFMPKMTGFLGGTFIENYDGSDEDLNNIEFSKLIERAKYVYGFYNSIDEKFVFEK